MDIDRYLSKSSTIRERIVVMRKYSNENEAGLDR